MPEEARRGLDRSVGMQIDEVRKLVLATVAPHAVISVGVGHDDAFVFAKRFLHIPDGHSYERLSDGGLYRRRTYQTRERDTFFIEVETRGSDGKYRVTARELRRLGAEAMKMNSDTIAREGVPIF